MNNTGFLFSPTREQFLFGYLDQTFNTPSNYLVLHLKKYIWRIKFQPPYNLSLVGFKNYFVNVLNDLKLFYELSNNSAEFYAWNGLLELLPAVHLADTDALHHHHPRQHVA